MKAASGNARFQASIQRFQCGFFQQRREKLINALPMQEIEQALHEKFSSRREQVCAPRVP